MVIPSHKLSDRHSSLSHLIFSPNSSDRVILCRGEQRAILNCLRDIFTQIEKIPPRGQVHLCMTKISTDFSTKLSVHV